MKKFLGILIFICSLYSCTNNPPQELRLHQELFTQIYLNKLEVQMSINNTILRDLAISNDSIRITEIDSASTSLIVQIDNVIDNLIDNCGGINSEGQIQNPYDHECVVLYLVNYRFLDYHVQKPIDHLIELIEIDSTNPNFLTLSDEVRSELENSTGIKYWDEDQHCIESTNLIEAITRLSTLKLYTTILYNGYLTEKINSK